MANKVTFETTSFNSSASERVSNIDSKPGRFLEVSHSTGFSLLFDHADGIHRLLLGTTSQVLFEGSTEIDTEGKLYTPLSISGYPTLYRFLVVSLVEAGYPMSVLCIRTDGTDDSMISPGDTSNSIMWQGILVPQVMKFYRIEIEYVGTLNLRLNCSTRDNQVTTPIVQKLVGYC